MSRGLRVSLVGGGSGGDTYPLVAAALELQRQGEGAVEVQFFGTEEGIEGSLLRDAGFDPVTVPAVRLKRQTLLRLPFVLCRGTSKARAALRDFGADLVVAGGGFVSPPVVLAARWLGIPVALLEPNAVAGRANRVLARAADLVVTAYPSAAATLPDPSRVECLGMPLRIAPDAERRAARRGARSAKLVAGICGGSLGARALNQAAWQQYAELAALEGLHLIHVTGKRDHADALGAWHQAGRPTNVEVREYQAAMDELYDEVDVLLTRGGGLTCAELIEFAVPSLIVPRPGATYDHTTRNAEPLAAAGGAELIPQDRFSAAVLRERLESLLEDPGRVEAMRSSYAALQNPGAAARVAERLRRLASRSLEVAA